MVFWSVVVVVVCVNWLMEIISVNVALPKLLPVPPGNRYRLAFVTLYSSFKPVSVLVSSVSAVGSEALVSATPFGTAMVTVV